MKRFALLAVMLAAPALMVAVPTSAAPLPSLNWPAPADRGAPLLRSVALNAHNDARASFGVAPVAWSELLANEAMGHAQYMAQTGIYGHDQTPGRRKKQGENLWRGPRGVFSYDIMVGLMVDEVKLFKPGLFPDNSVNGDWHQVAHFTQIVWPSTTEVGCALASSATTDYFVCRYAPTGNKDGLYLAQTRELAERGD